MQEKHRITEKTQGHSFELALNYSRRREFTEKLLILSLCNTSCNYYWGGHERLSINRIKIKSDPTAVQMWLQSD